VVRLSRDDLPWLDPAEPAATAGRWLAAGAALVVVTSGREGATAYHRSGEVSVPAEPVELVDTIGDAFNAGLLGWLYEAGRLRRDGIETLGSGELAEALRLAGRVAALTCERAGADPPHLDQLEVTRRSRGGRQDRG
jgi:fructokinase